MCKQVVGIDPDESVLRNKNLDQAYLASGESIPLDSEKFDIAISDNVWEHIQNPKEFLKEIWRVLKPNGIYLAKTPNTLHYVPLIAKITPHWFHERINSLRGRSHCDTFETHYRLNSRHAISKNAAESGYHVEFFRSYEGRPEYLRLSTLTYLFGIAYERLVNLTKFTEKFRVIHIVKMRKVSTTL
jgi:SAM-dependent methyltransferase